MKNSASNSIQTQIGESLQDVMNSIAGQTDTSAITHDTAPLPHSPTKKLSELEALSSLDPLLAGLYKDYLQSKAARIAIATQHGAESPMAEVAIDLEDSSWCAVQTRYLEVRADRELMKQAQSILLAQEEIEIEEKLTQEQKKREQDLWIMVHLTKMLEK